MELQPPLQDEELILEHVQYFNVLMLSIQTINTSIVNGTDGREAAENLLADLPEDWSKEINEQVNEVAKKYNGVLKAQKGYFVRGVLGSVKNDAMMKIHIAGKEYSRNIKKIVISLLKKKDLLYTKRKAVETGYLSLVAPGDEGREDD